jgi:hypothetical protein
VEADQLARELNLHTVPSRQRYALATTC